MTSKIKVDNIADQDDNNIINESGDVITVGAAGDTVAVAGNIVKSNALQASDGGNIVSQSGTTITLGASGDTITLASGASQTGFGRTGTVDWQTGSIKTATFTAANGEGYFCNTAGGAFTVNLPAGSAGAIVSIADYGDNFNTNPVTVAPNGSEKISGEAQSAILETQGQSVTLIYVDGTEGWVTVNDSSENVKGDAFIAATGGTVTDCGNCRIHTFTSPGTFTVSKIACVAANNEVSYLVIGGGGAGGAGASEGGGGGGAGGFREDKSPITPYCSSPLEGAGPITVTATAFPITVGGGAPAGPNTTGTPSVFSTITSTGGGSGGGAHQDPGNAGGSGGGGTGRSGAAGGSGNTPPVSPPQGNGGGNAIPGGCNPDRGGGGGGAAAGGSPASGSNAGPGGGGESTSITGSAVTRSGGGGGGKDDNQPNGGIAGSGGAGGGGRGASSDGSPQTAEAGEANTGGGGGGQAKASASRCGQNGGSGIVVIRYKKR